MVVHRLQLNHCMPQQIPDDFDEISEQNFCPVPSLSNFRCEPAFSDVELPL